jgi:CubicO group peptidase (beta-lactamase class C family)
VGGRRALRVAAIAAGLLIAVPAAQARSHFDAAALDAKLRAEPGVLSVLVERDGRLIFERYYRGAARRGRLDVFSVTKSVTSTLVGIAAHQGVLRIDQRLRALFPKDVQHARDKRVRKITLRHLLTMTGIAMWPRSVPTTGCARRSIARSPRIPARAGATTTVPTTCSPRH